MSIFYFRYLVEEGVWDLMEVRIPFFLIGVLLTCLFCGRKSSTDEDSAGSAATYIPSSWDGLTDLESTSWGILTP